MTLISTPTHPDADSFISLAEADTYVTENKVDGGVWDTSLDPAKEAALRQATKIINKFRFHNSPFSTTQSLKFPDNSFFGVNDEGGMTTTTVTSVNQQEQAEYPDNFWKYGAIQNTEEASTAYLKLSEISASVFSTGVITFATMTGIAADDTWMLIEKVPNEVRYATVETAMWILDGNLSSSSSTTGIDREKIGDYEVEYAGSSYSGVAELPSQAKDYLIGFISITGRIVR